MKLKIMISLMLLVVLSLMATISHAQSPQKFNYQGIARDTKGNPLSNQKMSLKLSVLPTADATVAEYEETQNVVTNEFGLYTLQIGNGTVLTGTMKDVKWETGNKYIKVAIDAKGGTDFVDIGTSQLLSVPYALYADKSGSATTTHGGTRTGTVASNATHVAGDANYVTKFTALNTIGKSSIYDNGNFVGIGTTTQVTPLFKFQLQSADELNFMEKTTSPSKTANFRLWNSDNKGLEIYQYGSAGPGTYMGLPRANLSLFNSNTGTFAFNASGDLVFGNNATPRLYIQNGTGNIGIGTGTTAPAAKLDVNGQVRIQGGTPGVGKVLTSNATGLATWTTPSITSAGGTTNYIPKYTPSGSTLGNSMLKDSNATGLIYNSNSMPDAYTGLYYNLPINKSSMNINTPLGSSYHNYLNMTSNSTNPWQGFHMADSAKYFNWFIGGTSADSVGTIYFNKTYNKMYFGNADPSRGLEIQVDNGKMGNTYFYGNANFNINSNYDTAGHFTSSSSNYLGNGILRAEYDGATNNYDNVAVYGKSHPTDDYGYGVVGEGGYYGVSGITDRLGAAGMITHGPGHAQGIDASSDSSNAVYAYSYYGTGANVSSNNGVAVIANSYYANGVNANSNKGIGINAASDSNQAGVFVAGNAGYSTALTNGVVRGEYTGTYVQDAVGVYGKSVPDATQYYGIGVKGEGGYIGVSGNGHNSGNNSYGGLFNSTAGSSSNSYGVYGVAYGGATNYAGYFPGTLYATTGTFGTKPFMIDHPLDPTNKFLRHSSIESNDMMNIYNGNITTDANGYATVTMPDYFEALNENFKYQLTVIGTFAQAIIKEEVANNKFVIQTNQPNVKVSWQVSGVRHDAVAKKYPVVVEEMKPEGQRGLYLEPEAFGQPRSMGANYPESQKKMDNKNVTPDYKSINNKYIETQKEERRKIEERKAEHEKNNEAARKNWKQQVAPKSTNKSATLGGAIGK